MGIVADHFGLDHMFPVSSSYLNRQGHTQSDHYQNHQHHEEVGRSLGLMPVHYHINLYNQLTKTINANHELNLETVHAAEQILSHQGLS
jgi:hypothetical protein